jgi:TldD protein
MELEEFADKVIVFASNAGCHYCDVRAESITKKGILIENGEIEYPISKEDRGLGIRILYNGAWGFYSISNPLSLKMVEQAVINAARTARHYSEKNNSKVQLVDIPTNKDKRTKS